MILFQVDLLEQKREEAFILLGITTGLFLAALILIAILILRRKSKQSEELALDFSTEIPKIGTQKPREKRKGTKPTKEITAKKKEVDTVDPQATKTSPKKEVPEDFMPRNPKTAQKEPKQGNAPKEFSMGPTKQATPTVTISKQTPTNPKDSEENTKKIEQSKSKEPKAPIAPKSEVGIKATPVISSENAAPPLSKDQVAKNVAEAIDRGNSKEDNMARVQAYLEELKAKKSSAKGNGATEEIAKPVKRAKENTSEEKPKAEDKARGESQAIPDPEMPSGALTPPFVPTPNLPETPTSESIRLEFEKPEERPAESGEKGSREVSGDPEDPSLSSPVQQLKGSPAEAEKPSISLKVNKSAPSKESGPELSGGIQEKGTDLDQAQPHLPPAQTPTTTTTTSKGSAVALSEKEVEPVTKQEENAKKAPKGKKVPMDGYRSFADWLRQTKG